MEKTNALVLLANLEKESDMTLAVFIDRAMPYTDVYCDPLKIDQNAGFPLRAVYKRLQDPTLEKEVTEGLEKILGVMDESLIEHVTKALDNWTGNYHHHVFDEVVFHTRKLTLVYSFEAMSFYVNENKTDENGEFGAIPNCIAELHYEDASWAKPFFRDFVKNYTEVRKKFIEDYFKEIEGNRNIMGTSKNQTAESAMEAELAKMEKDMK